MAGVKSEAVRRMFALPKTEAAIAALIVLSSLVTVATLAAPSDGTLRLAGDALYIAFAIELAVRFFANRREPRRFFTLYGADVVALVTLVPPFAGIPLFLLLRFARLFHAYRVLQRIAGRLRGGVRAVVLLSGMTAITLIVASAALLVFERERNPQLASLAQTGWFTVYSLIAAEPIPAPPLTWGGRLVSAAVIGMGFVSFATIAGTVSAVVSERMRQGGTIVDWAELEGHLIICGWNRKAELIVREYRDAGKRGEMPIAVIAEIDGEPPFQDSSLRSRVQFLNDDFTKVAALDRAGVKRARKCIILSDTSRGRKERDADARTILAALTIERLNPTVYTCAEINRREYVSHLQMGNVNDYVVSGEHSAFLLAQAALTRGAMGVFQELLSFQHGSKFLSLTVPGTWKDKTFTELLIYLKETHDALLVAVEDKDGKSLVNPRDYRFKGDEEVVVITTTEFQI